MHNKYLSLLKKANAQANGEGYTLGNTQSEKLSQLGFPLSPTFVHNYLVENSNISVSDLTGAKHYLVFYRSHDAEQYTLMQTAIDGGTDIAVAAHNVGIAFEEIDLFYKPATGAIEKVFGLGIYAKADENNVGNLLITVPAAGTTAGICLIYQVSLADTPEAAYGLAAQIAAEEQASEPEP